MEFVNETDYDWRALRALNRAAIRLDRRWRSLLLRAMGVLCGLILLRGAWTSGGGAGLLYGLLGALMLVWALFLNEIRAWLVGRFVMKGVARHTSLHATNATTIPTFLTTTIGGIHILHGL